MSNEQEMREAFEAAVTAHFEKPTDLTREGEGYSDGYVDNAWWGWQAATLAAEARIREKCMQVATTVRYAALSGPVERCELDAIISRALTEHKENQG